MITTRTKELLSEFLPDLDRYIPNQIDTLAVIGPDFDQHFFSSAKKAWIFSTDTPELIAYMGSILPENVELILEATFVDSKQDEELCTVTLACKGKTVVKQGRFLVGADGGRS